MKATLTNVGWEVVDWLFPPTCVGCGEPGQAICDVCKLSIRKVNFPKCRLCASPMIADGVCYRCLIRKPDYDELICYALYTGLIRKSIHQLKYARDLGMGRYFAKALVPLLLRKKEEIDLVIPMPLSKERMKLRGYNQATAIAKPLCEEFGWSCETSALVKIRETESQVHLSADERLSHLDGAFGADARIIIGKRILILDDVFTTGATMFHASKALREAGANQVLAVTVARTLLNRV